MANPHRGSAALQAGDKAYTLSLSVNAICELEDLLDEPVAQIAKRLENPDSVRLNIIRALMWAALRDHHDHMTLKDAGALVSDAGVPAAMDAIGRAFALAFPEEDAKTPARPRKAKAS